MISFATLNQLVSEDQREATFSLTATVDSALCVGAGGSSGSLSDKPILKNSDGRLVIPASQLKGRLRHECEKLARGLGWPICESPVAERMCPQWAKLPGNTSEQPSDEQLLFKRESQYKLKKIPGYTHHPNQRHCLVCQLFGNPSLPARLSLSDLVCTERAENVPDVLRPGVTINRRRRTAEEKKLYFVETSPANAALAFEGTLTLSPAWPLENDETRHFAMALLVTGLKHVFALGGSKSAGLGWVSWQLPEAMSVADDEWGFLGEAIEHRAANAEGNA